MSFPDEQTTEWELDAAYAAWLWAAASILQPGEPFCPYDHYAMDPGFCWSALLDSLDIQAERQNIAEDAQHDY
jgi:hypothetical protein